MEHNGGTFLRKVAVLDIYREHNHLKPEGIAELNEAGRELARVIARDVAQTIDGAVGLEGDASRG